MTSTRRWNTTRGLRLAALGGVLLVSQAAAGQDRLGPGFPANPAIWTDQQSAEAQAFVEAQLRLIQDGDETSISRGKTALVDALTFRNATPQYTSQLSETIARRLEPVLTADRQLVRINIMIICTHLVHPSALRPIESGLADPNAGVRYPAVTAISNILFNGELNKQQREQALDKLTGLAKQELDPFVTQALLNAIDQTQDDKLMLDVLGARVNLLFAQPVAAFDAETRILQAIFTRITTGSNPSIAQLRELMKVCGRYYWLAAKKLVDGNVPPDRVPGHNMMAEVAATGLAEAFRKTPGATGISPERPNIHIQRGNWGLVLRIALQWGEILKAPPYNFTDADLHVGE